MLFPEKGADHHIFQDRQAGKGLDDLEGAADAGGADLIGPHAMNGFAFENNRAGVGREDARDHVEDRRLARAVRPDKGVDAAFGELERRVRHRLEAAE
jgi:hypothetical protein